MVQTTGERNDATDGPVAVLVGCGKAKHDGLLPAKDKYSSNYFALKRNYAEKLGDDWCIVSAKYGVVEPDDEIDDYDTTVRDMRANERALWGETTGHNIVKWLSDLEKAEGYPSEVHLLLGTAYQEPLADYIRFLEEATDVDVVRPFEGTSGIGEQMAELKAACQPTLRTENPDEDWDYWTCPSCGEPIADWTDCPRCGWYDGDAWEAVLEGDD